MPKLMKIGLGLYIVAASVIATGHYVPFAVATFLLGITCVVVGGLGKW